MRRFFPVIFVMIFLVSMSAIAQEAADQSEEGRAERKTLAVDIGNMFIINGGIHYRASDLPYGSVGIGFDFQLDGKILLSSGVEMVQKRVTPGASYSGATNVEGGEINSIDISLGLKYFVKRNWWLASGFTYEVLTNGYYIDDTGVDTLYVDLSSSGESNNLGFQVATGMYAAITENVYAIPGFSLRYNLPTERGYSFSSSDITFSLDFSIGIKM